MQYFDWELHFVQQTFGKHFSGLTPAVAPALQPRGRVPSPDAPPRGKKRNRQDLVQEQVQKVGIGVSAGSVAVAGSQDRDPVQELEQERRLSTGMTWS